MLNFSSNQTMVHKNRLTKKDYDTIKEDPELIGEIMPGIYIVLLQSWCRQAGLNRIMMRSVKPKKGVSLWVVKRSSMNLKIIKAYLHLSFIIKCVYY